ncbi:hypothetical protein [Saccharobesus litoralis]|nr:hypothetical protein [Saccharobesus litoralis]
MKPMVLYLERANQLTLQVCQNSDNVNGLACRNNYFEQNHFY